MIVKLDCLLKICYENSFFLQVCIGEEVATVKDVS